MLDIQKEIRLMLADEGKTQADLARMLGTSPANFNNKYQKENFRTSELEEIAEKLGYILEVKFKKK